MSIEIVEPSKAKIDLESIKKKRVNIAIFGHGNVGSKLIDQIIESNDEISRRRDFDIRVFAIANSDKVLLSKNGVDSHWNYKKKEHGLEHPVSAVLDFVEHEQLENLIAVDNTASEEFVENYPLLIRSGFHLVSANKIGNTKSLDFYQTVRNELRRYNKEYLYETNVGAGLPLIDTIKLLHLSGENITRIKGVFSGSLSYIFNTFSEGKVPFSTVVKKAMNNGLTEPDPREDLCGNDVARKLLILARELELHNELEDVSIENLIPKDLRKVTKIEFLENISSLDVPFEIKKKNLPKDHVFRFIGDLHGDLSQEEGAILEVKLVAIPKNTSLGQLKGSDSIFEIFTENYGVNPIVIQGAGAGAKVTARGVFGDILRLSEKLN